MMKKTLDTSYTVETPEGITLHLSPAGHSSRLLAWILDLLIRAVINIVVFMALLFAGKTGIGIALIIIFLLEWFYPVFFELMKAGQTPGKKVLNIYVAQENGSPISVASSIIRNLLRVVDFLPFMYGFALVSMLLNRRFQRLGDLVANTVVLHKTENVQYISLKNPENTAFTHQSIRPNVSFTLQEQQALISYAQRNPQLSIARAEELAKFTGILVRGKKSATAYLLGIANWLIGKRV